VRDRELGDVVCEQAGLSVLRSDDDDMGTHDLGVVLGNAEEVVDVGREIASLEPFPERPQFLDLADGAGDGDSGPRRRRGDNLHN
jgi:hypothetical protein